MIQIICGTYGKMEGRRVVAKTARSAPFELTDQEEARLVGLGVAKYVEPTKDWEAGLEASPGNREGGAPNAAEIPEYNVDMKADTLRAIGEKYGLKFKTVMSKADMVAALDNYFSESLGGREEAE